MSAVSAQPDQLGRSRVPGQSFHQNATMATSGSEKVTSGPSTSTDPSAPPAPNASSAAIGTTSSSPATPGRRRARPRVIPRLRAGSITSSGAIGSSRTRRPVAWNTALAMAAAAPTWPISPTPLAPSGPTTSSLDLDELDGDVRRVGVDGHEVLGRGCSRAQRPWRGIHAVALQQRLAQAPEHPAHQLAAGEPRVEHPPGREHADHPPDADQSELRVDGDLGELRAEGQQPVRGVERRRAPACPVASASARWLRASSSP